MSEEYVCGAAVEWVNVTALREQVAASEAQVTALREVLGEIRSIADDENYNWQRAVRHISEQARVALLADPSLDVRRYLAAVGWTDAELRWEQHYACSTIEERQHNPMWAADERHMNAARRAAKAECRKLWRDRDDADATGHH